MSYIVLARKFRPTDFDELVGQEHVTTTLKNAIAQNRIAHAYLFAGPRGVGKTSTARILAKALNCEKGLTSTPCNKCASCGEIARGVSLDVIEIDGASNRGIDEVRALRENVRFAPANGRFKIYIIDEVHMLTTEAFNALLKTLEEPPPHVKFIFATTSAHKIPATMLSRCQRFDFRKISLQEIVEKLKEVSKKENISIDEPAIYAIARVADGSMRDAESLLDQLASFTKDKVTSEDLSKLLGGVREEELFAIAQAIIERDAAGAVARANKSFNEGADPVLFLQALIEHFRNLMMAKISKSPAGLIERDDETLKRLSGQAESFTFEELLYITYLFLSAADAARRTFMAKVPIELALVKLSRRENMLSLEEVLKRLEGVPAEAQIATHPKPSPQRVEGFDIKYLWPQIIEKVKSAKMLCGALLEHSVPALCEGEKLLVLFPKDLAFNKEALEKKDNVQIIESVLFDVAGKNFRIAFEVDKESRLPAPKSGASDDPQPEAGPRLPSGGQAPRAEIMTQEPLLKNVLAAFKGNVIRFDADGRPN